MSNNIKLNRPELKMNNKGKSEPPGETLKVIKYLRSRNFPSMTCFDCQFHVRRQTCQMNDKQGCLSLSEHFHEKFDFRFSFDGVELMIVF